jgi:site-specific recombinase XerC
MSNLKYQLLGLCNHNRDGSQDTQEARRKVLLLASTQLRELGFKLAKPNSLKPKHVEALVNRWQQEGLSAGTIKNRMAHIRWWAAKVNKLSMLPKSNNASNHAISLNIPKRSFVNSSTPAKDLEKEKLEHIKSQHLKFSLRLQEEFGLRRSESLKFNVSYAYSSENALLIRLKPSWTKGGRAREIPILNSSQKALLDEIKGFAGNDSLIPSSSSYKLHLKLYENECNRVGLDKNHGLRHRYAQNRYFELTGWNAPRDGGPKRTDLTLEQKHADFEARMIISNELGHNREQITALYLGR